MATISTGAFAKALKPQVQAWFGDEYKDVLPLYTEYMEVVKSADAYEEDVLLSGLGLGRKKPEGAAATYDDMSQGFTKRYMNVTYTNGFIITRELMEDAKAPARAERFAKALRRGMENTRETVAANVLNRAFDSNYTGGDAKELCATDHPTMGADLRNEPSVAADLSEAALEQAIIDLMDMKDNRGLRVAIRPRKLVVPTALAFEADRILNSPLRVAVADNDLNAIKHMGMMPEGHLTNPFLTDTDAWFIITDAPDGLKYIDRRDLAIEDDNEFDTMNVKFLASMRFDTGWSDPRGVFGSPGAA